MPRQVLGHFGYLMSLRPLPQCGNINSLAFAIKLAVGSVNESAHCSAYDAVAVVFGMTN